MSKDKKDKKDNKTNAMRLLDSAGIEYDVNFYDCDEFVDGTHIADMLGQSHEMSFKTLVAVGKSSAHYVFVLPIDEELNLKLCAASVGEKSVELVHVKDIFKLTGYVRGGVSPIGMKKQLQTVIDSSAKNFDKIIISAGKLGAQIFIAPADLEKIINAKFAPIIL